MTGLSKAGLINEKGGENTIREMFLGTAEMEDSRGGAHCYDYYIIIDEMDVGAFSCESYGLRVEDRARGEGASVPHITCSISRIDELCELVLGGGVSPTELSEVVQDWL